MRIVLMRHAIAEDTSSGGDAARQLTSEGRKKAHDVCRALAGMDLGIERVMASPLARAQQTAQILREAIKLGRAVEESQALLPEGSPQGVSALFKGQKVACVALVGHEPFISRFASWTVGGGKMEVRKSGVVILETPDPGTAGGGQLVGLFAPRHIRPLL